MIGEPPRLAKPARYLVVVAADGTLTITTLNRVTVESTQLARGEMPEEALMRLGYNRATIGGRVQPMVWSPREDGSLFTTAVRAEQKP